MARKWNYTGDCNMLDYGGTFYRKVGDSRYQFIDFVNMDEACGRDNEGRDRYCVSLREVDLMAIPMDHIHHIIKSMDLDPNASEAEIAYACQSYGCYAPLEEFNGNNAYKLLREARSLANSLAKDESARARALERPVNAIGSTASEYMQGDYTSALMRGIERNNRECMVMAKIMGAAEKKEQ